MKLQIDNILAGLVVLLIAGFAFLVVRNTVELQNNFDLRDFTNLVTNNPGTAEDIRRGLGIPPEEVTSFQDSARVVMRRQQTQIDSLEDLIRRFGEGR